MPSNHLILCGYYNYVEWKSLWDKQNEAPQSYVKLLVIHKWCCVYSGIGRGFSIISSFWKTKWLILTSTCSQLNKLNAALDEKHLELVKRKRIILHQNNSRPLFLMIRQKLLQLGWEVLIHPPQSPDIATSDFHLFWSLRNSLKGEISIPWKTIKDICNSSLLKNIKSFGKMELWSCLKKSAEGSRTKLWIHCSIKFLVKMKTVSFIFT